MTTDRALLALPAGAALAGLATLLGWSPAVGLAGWAICFVFLGPLGREQESFSTARFGAVLGLAAGVLELGGWFTGLATFLVLLALLLLLTGGCAGMRDLLPEGTRRAAASRISTASVTTLGILALLVALGLADTGSGWATPLGPWVRGAGVVVVAWFTAYVVLARTAVARSIPARG